MTAVMLAMLGVLLAGIGLAFIGSLVLSVPVYFLWNWVGPAVFGGPHIGFWHVWGMLMLVGLVLAFVRSKVTTKG